MAKNYALLALGLLVLGLVAWRVWREQQRQQIGGQRFTLL